MTHLKQLLAHPCVLWHGDSGGRQEELSAIPGAEPSLQLVLAQLILYGIGRLYYRLNALEGAREGTVM